MVLSMTGFGRSKKEIDQWTITVEIKSVNHRFCEISVRMPKNFLVLEEKIKKIIQSKVSRGRIELYVTMNGDGILSRSLAVDWNLADQYIKAFTELKRKYHLPEPIQLSDIVSQEHIFDVREQANEDEELEKLVLETVREAADNLLEMRAMEGKKLKDDLVKHLDSMEQLIKQIKSRAHLVSNLYKEKLKKRIAEFLQGNIDENRILMEAALLADKSDITEELTRLESHVIQFKETMKKSEPTGRKLDFIVQEMNREANTIGAKGNDSSIAKFVVELKSIIEKLKEQVQNIE